MSKEYPVEIYPKPNERIKDSAERIYDLGFRDGRFKERLEASNPLAGWSNLTYAIQAGERIDWEKLDGLEAKCVHPELGTLTYRLERNTQWSKHTSIGWHHNKEATWAAALNHAWGDKGRWSLWVKGDLPLRKLTADQLEPGTCFLDIKGNSHIVYITPRGEKVAYARYGSHDKDPKYVYVGKVLGVGTFQEPEEDA